MSVGRAGPHGDCGLRDQVTEWEKTATQSSSSTSAPCTSSGSRGCSIVINDDLAEAGADATAPKREPDRPGGFQSIGLPVQLDMVFPARRGGHNKLAFVQYPVVSDSPLKDAIRACL